MSKLRNPLITAAVLGTLALIGSVMNSHTAIVQGASGPTVTIDPSQLPLSVKLSSSVSGTVAAAQSGLWNVGITGTPTVNLNNSALNPVFVRDVDSPARSAYQSVQHGCPVVTGLLTCTFSSVAANHRLVVQHISGYADTAAPQPVWVQLQLPCPGCATNPTGAFASFLSPPGIPAFTGNVAAFDVPLLAYFDAGQQPQGLAFASPGVSIFFGDMELTGYVLDCSVAPCAAFAH